VVGFVGVVAQEVALQPLGGLAGVQFAGEEVVEAGEFEEEGEFEEVRFSAEEFEEAAETHGEGLGWLRGGVWWYDGASRGFGYVDVGGSGRGVGAASTAMAAADGESRSGAVLLALGTWA